MRFLPVFLDLTAGTVALIGAGPAARNKLRLLCAAGADVRWYSGDADVAEEMVLATAPPGRLEVSLSDPLQANFREFRMVVAATGTPLDDEVAALARAGHVPVNVVDRPELSSFIFPAIIDRGEVVVAIGTGGASPVLARRLRERIEAMLPARIGELAALLRRYRTRLAEGRHGARLVRRFWEQAIDGRIGAAVAAGRGREAEAALIYDIASIGKANAGKANASNTNTGVSSTGEEFRPTGTVHLVGAGPGDPDLLTLRALHALQGADLVFYDELVTPGIVDRARRDAERVFVGKRRGVPGISQDEINRRLRDAARDGRNVVRLKGGDPFVFGRGGEELDYLRRHDIAVIVVPGITAALGCAAEAGLPLTLRSEATLLCLVTAHLAADAQATDWSGLADSRTTVVVYMGLAAAAAVRDGLIAAGRDPCTPVAVLARGTRPDAASVAGRLDALEALAAQVGEGPALIVVGDVVAHSDPWLAALAAHAAREIAA
jgi:uroporphyrin-III C-methyltransferase/precorrin-2 dehydrogenase/sirohydrochlorin ferrochelatase